jgi:hypothetical protein
VATVLSVDIELALVGLTAMLEPATLLASVMALVVGERPLRTGSWFYLGGLAATMSIGLLAALLLGSAAATHTSEPKTWVSLLTLLAGVLVLWYVVRLLTRRRDADQTTARIAERMNRVASGSALAIVAAGAALANPGVFMVLAAKTISQLNPSTSQYVLDWALFALVALLPLAIALLTLLAAPDFSKPRLAVARGWIERNGRIVLAIILLGLAGALVRDGITGLTR